MTVTELSGKQAAARRSRRISILGATGSVGTSTADLVRRNPDAFDVAVLTANRNAADLAVLARELRPDLAIVADETAYSELKQALTGTGIEVAAGADALVQAAREPVDMTVAGIVGAAGLDSSPRRGDRSAHGHAPRWRLQHPIRQWHIRIGIWAARFPSIPQP